MEGAVEMEPENAIKLAKEYLAGNWLRSTAKTVSLRVLSGGFCSKLYVCEDLTGSCEPSKFLIRLNEGQILEGNEEFKSYNEGTESIVFFMHGHLGYGPKLYGVIENGRLEEFIPSRTLNNQDLDDPNIRMQLARKVARFHSMKLPVSKKQHPPFELFTSGYKLYNTKEGRQIFLDSSELCGVDPSWVDLIDVQAESDWLRHTLEKVGGRMVISLNDMNRLNCLIRDSPDTFGEVVTLVDYELGGTNWRGYDIGAHFFMWTVDAKKDDFLSGKAIPDETIRREFVAEYLRQTEALNVFDDFDPNGLDSADHVLMESDIAALLYALYFITQLLKPPVEGNVIFSDIKQKTKFLKWGGILGRFYVERKSYILEKYDNVLKSEVDIISKHV